MRVLILAACATVAVIAGCGGDESTTTTPEAGTLVTYERTGGFASMPQSLVIEADGSATVEAGVDPAREAFELTDEELGRLQAELDAADFVGFDLSTEPTGCADCYAYELTYGGTTISYDESESVPEPMTILVTHLNEIAGAHYPPEADEPPTVN
jgi:hypothetical protein